MNETPPESLRSLTGLRFWAAVHVLLFHATSFRQGWVGRVVGAGASSVGLFFVLSGFILGYRYLADDRPFPTRAFWVARFARIYPVYLAGVLLVLLFVSLPTPPLQPGNDVSASALLASLFLVQAWVPQLACAVNCPAWSLSNEAFFYLMFPLIGVMLRRWSTRRLAVSGVALCLLSAILLTALYSRSGANFFAPGWMLAIPAGLAWFPLVRFPEFAVGILIGIVAVRHRPALSASSKTFSLMFLLACVTVLMLYSVVTVSPWRVMYGAFLLPAFAILILTGAFADRSVQSFFGNRLSVRLGEMSYSLYILHYPLMLLYTRGEEFGIVPRTSERIGLLLELSIIMTVAYAAFVLIERPARRRIRTLLGAPSSTPTGHLGRLPVA